MNSAMDVVFNSFYSENSRPGNYAILKDIERPLKYF